MGDLHRLLKITIPSVTCPTTSKRHAELIDMKTFTPPIGRAGCLLSRIWTSPVPPPSICVSLMHKAVISQMHQPLRKVSLGITAYLKGIKNVLDRLAASLIPRSRSSHRAVLYARASVKFTHNISPAPEATSFIVSRLMFDIADVFRHTSASFTLTVQSFLKKIISACTIPHILSRNVCFRTSRFFLMMAIIDKESVGNSPRWSCSFAAR